MIQSGPPRARDLTIPTGYWQEASTPHNAITDVPGVRVAHTTLIQGEGSLKPGAGPVRTGVTVVLPHSGNLFRAKVCAAAHVINGFGKACGLAQVQELGQLETPIALTNTLNVWQIADALAQWGIDANPDIGISTSTVNPVVAECNDGYLNDIQGRHVQAHHLHTALAAALANGDRQPVPEGNVGGGTGMSCYGWKGGIGTAGRALVLGAQRFNLGALVQANFGRTGQLRFAGQILPNRRELLPNVAPNPPGSVVVVLATNAPLDARQLHRLCVRATAGLARTGTTIDHGSGDFVLAFSTARRIPHDPPAQSPSATSIDTTPVDATALGTEGQIMDVFAPAVVEAVEESVLNALCAAQTMIGRDGHIRHALPLDAVADLLVGA